MKKVKIMMLAILALGIVLGMVSSAAHAGIPQEKGKFAIGIAAAFPVAGLSAKYWFSDKVGGQAVAGLSGGLSMYGGRVLFKFKEEENYYLYGAVLVGNWSYKWDYGWLGSGSESVFGYGLAGGFEYFPKSIPSLGLALEIGYGAVNLE